MLNRRTLLQSLAASAAVAWAGPVRALTGSQTAFMLRVVPGRPLATIPANFIGLGYEMSSAARLGLLSTRNEPYVRLLHNLGAGGVLRFGGIVADFTGYSPDGEFASEAKHTVVTGASLRQLRGFLDATGWSAIWSVNFGRGTLDEAIAEARDVSRLLGPRLLAIELGNEVENYSHGSAPLRTPPYSYDTYRAEYTQWRVALLAAVPGLRFAAPDTAASVEWVERMAADAHAHIPVDVQLLTTHYYRGDQRLGTPEQLLHPDESLKSNLQRLRRASRASGVPFRICEANSFYGGGRPGVSDTLAGALWTLDYMLLLAQYGCAGVNLETGVNQLGFISSYSPVQDDGAGHNTAAAPYYGMLAFASAIAGASNVFAVEPFGSGTELAAYALGSGGRVRSVVLVNKSLDRSATVSLGELGLRGASAMRLAGPSLDSKTGVTFGGAAVDADGEWTEAKAEPVTGNVPVPPGSAVVIRRRM